MYYAHRHRPPRDRPVVGNGTVRVLQWSAMGLCVCCDGLEWTAAWWRGRVVAGGHNACHQHGVAAALARWVAGGLAAALRRTVTMPSFTPRVVVAAGWLRRPALRSALTRHHTTVGRRPRSSGRSSRAACSPGSECNGMEWNGMEWNGMEWNRFMEWNV